jgi:N-acetyltransferase
MRSTLDFELQPTLTGKLVHARPLRADDFTELYRVASDPLIWEQHPASDRYREPVFRQFFADGLACGGALAVLAARSGALIGSSRFVNLDREQRVIEIGWTFLARAYWGGSYNRELKQLMLRHAFQYVDAVHFTIGVGNIRSQRAIERIGATRIGTTTRGAGGNSFVYELRRATTAI